jgi:subtilase family serine protease
VLIRTSFEKAVTTFALLLLPTISAHAAVADPQQHNVISGIERFADLGPANPDEEINVNVQLAMHNKPAFDAAVEALYTPGSPTFHQWMREAEILKYAPTSTELATVRAELEKHGLRVIWVDPLGLAIRARGTIANAQTAFQTNLHEFSYQGKQFRANIGDARLSGEAGKLVAAVAGLERHTVRPKIRRITNTLDGKRPFNIRLDSTQSNAFHISDYMTDNCFTNPRTYTYTTSGASLPVGVYFGNVYGLNPNLACGFTAAQLQAHYGLTDAYAKGWDGKGQKVVLLEAYGYDTIKDDANLFSGIMGLPQLNSNNFVLLYPEGKPLNPIAGIELGWDTETALDVQWAHAMAPGAKIVVVAAAAQTNEDFLFCMQYISSNTLANSVSNSWEVNNEQFSGPGEMNAFNNQLKLMAARGISVNFSTGDYGDEGAGSPLMAPNIPSDSPYATAVGGTSILNKINGHSIETGWGNIATVIASSGVLDPPQLVSVPNGIPGFLGGGGGGESVFFAKPAWQNHLPGVHRLTPDVSALSDPYTGVPIVLTTSDGTFVEFGWGGTSLGCPIFSAIWAIANQVSGKPLGQAAPLIAKMTSDEITDILPVGSPTNPAGTIYDQVGPTFYTPASLLALPESEEGRFISAIWPEDSQDAAILSFGTDTSLTVQPGWDNVTGFGEPNGVAFLKAAAGKK